MDPTLTRRDLLGLAVLAAPLVGCRKEPAMSKMPVLFQAHGAPPLLEDSGWMAELAAWAKVLPQPTAIIVVSAHWEAHPVSIGATRPLPLIYDFYGFPEKFYRLQYPSPGAAEAAARVRQLLDAAGIKHVDDAERGLDHGTYIPLMCMYPGADIPVLQLSLPSMDPREIFAMGKALAPLRDEGVLLIGSGFLTHNLRALSLRETPAWASEFDLWTAEALARHDHDLLMQYRAKAPGVRESLPTHEHFVPVLFSAGAAPDAVVTFPITGFWWGGAMSRRSAQLG